MTLQDLSWDDHELLARIAHRYYIDGRTQEEIAHEFGLSRPKVQRLLERARGSGVVDIHIEAPPGLNLDLERAARRGVRPGRRDRQPAPRRPGLAARGGRAQRRPVPRAAPRATARSSPSATAATPARCRASSGRSPALDCVFVSAMGGSPRVDTPTNPNEICRALAERCGGRAESLYAPAYVESAEVRDRLLEQEAVAAHARASPPGRTWRSSASAAPTTAARWSAAAACRSTRSPGCASQGAVGDVLGNYVDVARAADRRAAQRAPHRPVDRRPAPDRDGRRRRQRGREAAGDPRRPPRRRRRRPHRRRGQRPGRPRARPRRPGPPSRRCRRPRTRAPTISSQPERNIASPGRRCTSAGRPDPARSSTARSRSATASRRSTSSTT